MGALRFDDDDDDVDDADVDDDDDDDDDDKRRQRAARATTAAAAADAEAEAVVECKSGCECLNMCLFARNYIFAAAAKRPRVLCKDGVVLGTTPLLQSLYAPLPPPSRPGMIAHRLGGGGRLSDAPTYPSPIQKKHSPDDDDDDADDDDDNDRTGQDRTEQNGTGQERTGQDRRGQDKTGQDRTGQARRQHLRSLAEPSVIVF